MSSTSAATFLDEFFRNTTGEGFMQPTTPQDLVNADLEGITLAQYRFNRWMSQLEESGDGFVTGFKIKSYRPMHVKLSWWKCWFWAFLPEFILGANPIKFRGWKIGHCLNCDADPYDGTVEAWSYDGGFQRGALIRCNRCGQLRWQVGESGYDY